MPSARPSTADKRKTFRELHKSGCFVIPNPWNVGSARYLQGLGFKALATTSSGHAHSEGYPDGAPSMDEVLAHYREYLVWTQTAGIIDRGAAIHRNQQPGRLLEHVTQWQQAKTAILGGRLNSSADLANVGDDVAVSQDHAFGITGGTRGKHQLRYVVGNDRFRLGQGREFRHLRAQILHHRERRVFAF